VAKPRFFIDRSVDNAIEIAGPDAKHIRDVLRLKLGDIIEVVDPEGNLADIELTDVASNVSGRVVKTYENAETLPKVYLFQALPKAAKMDDIVRQVTEIGVTGIVPILTERVIVKIEPDKAPKKRERWQKIAAEASKQSHRISIPFVSEILSWDKALDELAHYDQVVVFWEEEQARLPYEALNPTVGSVALVIGPEGGLADSEIADLKRIGADVVTLGKTILRVETAAPVATALVFYDLRKARKAGNL
jgi:16S rRNA (uracil1498-N3)-methyltransferase